MPNSLGAPDSGASIWHTCPALTLENLAGRTLGTVAFAFQLPFDRRARRAAFLLNHARRSSVEFRSGLLNVHILKLVRDNDTLEGFTLNMGTVDVDRFTGSCLITTAVRPKSKSKTSATMSDPSSPLAANDPRNWAGAPLLSMAASIRKPKNGQKTWPPPVFLPTVIHAGVPDHLTAAASHLQGAPLIRVPRYPNKKTGRRAPFVANPPAQSASVGVRTDAPSSSDSCSVTSDEGLASGGSDTSLPRLVKPKRRNKKAAKDQTLGAKVTKSSACELDDLIANQGDRLAELLRNSLNEPAAVQSTTASPPPLWTSNEDDIWSSSPGGCWTSPVWSTGHSPSSSWPLEDKRVIRRPEGSAVIGDANVRADSWNWDGNQLQVSSQLIASPFNGHRDIEIRFFSSSSPPPPPSSSSPSSSAASEAHATAPSADSVAR